MDPIALTALLLAALVSLWFMRQRSRGAAGAGRPKPKEGSGRAQRALEAIDTVAGWPPEVTRVLTQQERRAHGLLMQALPDHMVFAQLPLSRFIRVPTRNSYQEWMHRVSQLCADLVVCDTASQVVAVVEVRRPPGKDSERTQKRHDRMDRILRKAGIRVLVWNEEALPVASDVRDHVLGAAQDLSNAEGAALVSTRANPLPAPAGGLTSAGFGFTGQPPAHVIATLHEELPPIEVEDALAFAEPTPSTWFDNLDSAPLPLDPLQR